MKILILGKGECGKDMVASMLHDLTGLTFTSSSREMLDIIFPVLKVALGYEDCDKEKAFVERRNNRELWKSLIDLYNAADKAALARRICEVTDIYVGMRDDEEYAAAMKAKLFNVVLWVDSDERVGTVDPTMKIKYDPDTMVRIDNNKSVYGAFLRMTHVAAYLGRRHQNDELKNLTKGQICNRYS